MNHGRLWTPGNKLRLGVGDGIARGGGLSTGCYMGTMNHGTLHQKGMMYYCMVTNKS